MHKSRIHGTAKSYIAGCHCLDCRRAWAEWHYEWEHRPDDGHLALAREARAWALRYHLAGVPRRAQLPRAIVERYLASKTYEHRHAAVRAVAA